MQKKKKEDPLLVDHIGPGPYQKPPHLALSNFDEIIPERLGGMWDIKLSL